MHSTILLVWRISLAETHTSIPSITSPGDVSEYLHSYHLIQKQHLPLALAVRVAQAPIILLQQGC
jgi:hypothetical protein